MTERAGDELFFGLGGALIPSQNLQIYHCTLLITTSIVDVFCNQRYMHVEQQGNDLGLKYIKSKIYVNNAIS